MNELEQLRAAAPPRPDELAAKIAWRVEPLVGFILYGALWNLWLTLMAFTAGIFLGIGVSNEVGGGKDLAGVLAWVFAIVLGAVSVLFFVRWCRKRRGGAKRLIRDGIFADGKVVEKATDQAAQIAARLAFGAAGGRLNVVWYRVQFVHDITGYTLLVPFPSRADKDASTPVLFVPGYKYALAFDPSGRGFPCRIHTQ